MDFSILIQARLSSTRLPGKILYQLGDTKLNSISLMAKRLSNLKKEMDIAIITSENTCDRAISYIAKKNNLRSLNGSHDDVLERYYMELEEELNKEEEEQNAIIEEKQADDLLDF